MYGNEIKNIRIMHGYTQTQIEYATGIPQETISWIENEKGFANIHQCVLLADFYQISIDELIGREVKNKK